MAATETWPRLFLDCTGTYLFDTHTGVQRVVRNIVRHGSEEGARRGIAVTPCYFEEGRYFPAPLTPDGAIASRYSTGNEASPWFRAKDGYWAVLNCVARRVPHERSKRWLLAPAANRGLSRSLRAMLRTLRVWPGPPPGAGKAPIEIRAGDVLLTLDIAGAEGWDAVLAQMKRDGVHIASVFYDLIPIRHPEGLPQRFVDAFRLWLETVVSRAQFIVGISETVIADLREYIVETAASRADCPSAFATFRLGYGFDRVDENGAIRAELRRIFSDAAGVPVFLSVGWLDLRKNQLFVLEALKILRTRGYAPRWIVAGRRGPTTDTVLARINEANETDARIFVFHDLSDAELEFCYRSASAMIYPSSVEGFGLPMIEAMSRGLRVFASDIAVFREVGEGFAVFFPLDRPESLADRLETFCRDRDFPAARRVCEFAWPDWPASTRQLFDLTLGHFGQPAP